MNTTSALARGTTTMTTSPVQTRANHQAASGISEGPDASSYFALPRSSGIGTSAGNHRNYLNDANDGISPTADGISFGFGGFRNGEGRNDVGASTFGGSPVGTRFPIKNSGGTALDTSSADEFPSSMAGISSLPQGLPDTLAQQLPGNPYAHMPHGSASFASQRPAHSSHPSFHSESQGFDSRFGSGSVDLNGGLNKLQLNDGGFPTQRPGFASHASYDGAVHRQKYPHSINEESNYQPVSGYIPEGSTDLGLAYQGAARSRVEGGAISPTELTRMGSPFYNGLDSTSLASPHFRNASGSRLSEGQAAAIERKLRGMQPEVEMSSQMGNPLQRMQFPAYDFAGYQAARLNALAGFYPVSPIGGLGAAAFVPRGQRENDLSQVVRSPLLEEFRANSKGNKRYELKVSSITMSATGTCRLTFIQDIYNHVVEFSGDQHGSRFIQQKLETANSDEKEQVFREIQPNCLQLMTDVFGNYVVQKLFEHGNQTQKKILANQMKSHVLTLSTQMYGCRVVQKVSTPRLHRLPRDEYANT